MKRAMFETREGYVRWLKNEVDAIRKNGLCFAKKSYEKALKGEGKDEWMSINNTNSEEVWNSHLRWLKDQVEYLERKIRKYEREITKNS